MKKIEHHVHDGEHFEQWNKYKKIKSYRKWKPKNQIQQYSLFTPKHEPKETEYEKFEHFRCSNVLALSSKMPAFRSCQTNHIIQAETIFQMFERCFPNQCLQIKKKEFTDLGITHWIPNTAKTSHHKAWENLQWRRRWFTDSPS